SRMHRCSAECVIPRRLQAIFVVPAKLTAPVTKPPALSARSSRSSLLLSPNPRNRRRSPRFRLAVSMRNAMPDNVLDQRAMEAAYAAGFANSSEGYNAEYPFDGDFEND